MLQISTVKNLQIVKIFKILKFATFFTQIRVMGDDISIQRHGSGTRQLRLPSHLFLHPSFDIVTYTADIAVVRLEVPFQQTGTLRHVQRMFRSPIEGTTCRLGGW